MIWNVKLQRMLVVWAGRCPALSCLVGLLTPLRPASGQTWTQSAAPTMNWRAVAASADGSRLAAIASPGLMHSSTNGGDTWTAAPDAPNTPYLASVASAADGMNLAVTSYDWVHNYGSVYVSTNGGSTWTNISLPAVAAAWSAGGSKLLVAGIGAYLGPGSIWIATDAATTWNLSSAPTTNWSAIAASADGIKLVAGASKLGGPFWSAVEGPIYLSRDAGATWNPASVPNGVWSSVASSADGATLMAGGLDSIYLSTNGGAAWTTTSVPATNWNSVACSADGTRLLAAGAAGVYASTDSGATWFSSGVPSAAWQGVAASADGCKWIAAAQAGGIWTAQVSRMPRLSIAPLGNGVLLSWTVPSTDFTLQQREELTATNWADTAAAATLNSTTLQYQVLAPATRPGRFYRLKH